MSRIESGPRSLIRFAITLSSPASIRSIGSLFNSSNVPSQSCKYTLAAVESPPRTRERQGNRQHDRLNAGEDQAVEIGPALRAPGLFQAPLPVSEAESRRRDEPRHLRLARGDQRAWGVLLEALAHVGRSGDDRHATGIRVRGLASAFTRKRQWQRTTTTGARRSPRRAARRA